jgi:hypothetical protein
MIGHRSVKGWAYREWSELINLGLQEEPELRQKTLAAMVGVP